MHTKNTQTTVCTFTSIVCYTVVLLLVQGNTSLDSSIWWSCWSTGCFDKSQRRCKCSCWGEFDFTWNNFMVATNNTGRQKRLYLLHVHVHVCIPTIIRSEILYLLWHHMSSTHISLYQETTNSSGQWSCRQLLFTTKHTSKSGTAFSFSGFPVSKSSSNSVYCLECFIFRWWTRFVVLYVFVVLPLHGTDCSQILQSANLVSSPTTKCSR